MHKPLRLLLSATGLLFWLAFAPRADAAPDTFGPPAAFALPGGVVEQSSPTLADLTGDGVPEILIGTTTSNGATGAFDRPAALVVLRGDGTMLWSRDVGATINSSPAVADLDGDGQPEVVVSTGGGVADRDTTGYVIAFDRNGNERWRFASQDDVPADGIGNGFYSSPTLCDVDGDRDLEIALGGWDRRLYLLDHEGRSLWNNLPNGFPGPGYMNADTSWSTAACADLNGDGRREIVIGADIAAGGVLPDGTVPQDGGYLYVFEASGGVLARRWLPETVFSSPAVGDLDGNGTLEIVTGTGRYYWDARGRTDPSYVYAFDTARLWDGLAYSDPARLPDLSGWPQQTPLPGFSSPALADLDGDGDLEIVIGTGDPYAPNDAIAGTGNVHAWHHTGQPVGGWPARPTNARGEDAAITSSPTVADVDGDGQLEVLFSLIWDVQVFNADGTFQERLPTLWTVLGSPAMGDTDGNGRAEVWIGGSKADSDPSRGFLWRWEQGSASGGAQPWPQFHGDAAHSGLVARPADLEAERAIVVAREGSPDPAATTFLLRNVGDSAVNWRVREAPPRVEVVPSSDPLAGHQEALLTVIVYPDGLVEGTQTLGTVVIEGSDPATGAVVDTVSIPVTLTISEINLLYLPSVMSPGQPN